MATAGRLSNPPIKEALVDLRAPVLGAFDQGMLSPLWPQLRERYPKLEVRNQLQAQIEARAGQLPEAHASDLGFHALVLTSADGSRLAQFRKDGFTLSQLAGYTTADDLFDEAFDLWRRFRELVPRDKVSRVAVRYINRLLLPFQHNEPFERFLIAPIVMPDGAPQVISEFLTRSVLQIDPETQTVAIVTQRLEASDGPSTPFVLDLDVFRAGQFEPDDSLRDVLPNLRTIKNDLFFGLVTDEALQPYR